MKQMKTAKLGIVLQITEVASTTGEGRLWEVHDVERNRGFRVTLPSGALGEGAARRNWTDSAIEGAIGVAIERFLVGSPELLPGPLYEVQVTARDLQDFASLPR